LLFTTDRSGDASAALAATCKAAGLNPETAARLAEPAYTQAEFAYQLVSAFDRFGLWGHSLAVLKDAAQRINDPLARRLLARRQWYSRVTSSLIDDFAGADIGPKGEHSEILAFRALAQLETGDKDAAATVLTALRTRTGDYAAISWSLALSTLADSVDPKNAIEKLDAAIKEHPDEPVFPYLRGNALFQLGRADEAREMWTSAAKSFLSAGWSQPSLSVVQTLLDEGLLDEGLAAADVARRQFHTRPDVYLMYLRAKTMLIEAGRLVNDPAEELRQLDETARQFTRIDASQDMMIERLLLPTRIVLNAYDGDRKRAASLVQQALDRPGFVDTELALRLVNASTRLNLGLESKVLAAVTASQAQGASLRDRALFLVMAGKNADALKLADDELATTPADRRELVVRTRAWLHDLLQQPDALALWKEATTQYPGSLEMHSNALNASSTSVDQAFVDLLIKRVTELGGSDPDRPSVDVRFAKARALLSPGRGSRERDEAIGLMRAMVLETNPRVDEVRRALIDALLMQDAQRGIAPDHQAAIELLKAAAAVAQDRATMTFKLADLLRTLDRAQDAIAELTKLAMDPAAAPIARLRAADELASLGQYDLALQCIEQLQSSPALMASLNPFELAMKRAVLLTQLLRDADAIKSFRALLQQPISDATTIALIATTLRTLGDSAGAELAIKQLDNPAIPVQDRAMAKARIAETADPKTALAEYIEACRLNPTAPAAWLALANYHLRNNDLAAAEAAARDGLKNLPGNPELDVMLQRAIFAGQGDGLENLGALADAYSKNPAMAARGAALRAVAQAQKDKTLDDVAVLTRLADEFSDDAIIQVFVIHRLGLNGEAGFNRAVVYARRAALKFPSDPLIQAEAVSVLAQANQWKFALAAAMAWRAIERKPEADLAVGECLLALGRTREAVDSIRSIQLPAQISDNDVITARVIDLRVRSSVRLQDTAGAWKLLQPYLSQSARIRLLTALPTAATLVADVADVKTWISATASRMDPASPDDQIAIANAWLAAAQRLKANRTELLEKARTVSAALIATSPSAGTYERHAAVLREQQDFAGAVAAGREAVKLDPKSPAALGSLAESILASKGDLSEAAEVAERAIAMGTGVSQTHLILLDIRVSQFSAATDPAARKSISTQISQLLETLSGVETLNYFVLVKLANCAEVIEENARAISLYERVLKHEEPPVGKHMAAVKNNLAYMLLVENRGAGPNESLYRAKTLAEESVRLQESAACYSTLGAINAELADRPGGIAAYRKARELDGREISAKVGLADLLAAGNDAERAEAVELIAAIDAEIKSGRAISPERAAQLTQTKQRLSGK
jgi:tetratricopeptide (TPR) repeat protein